MPGKIPKKEVCNRLLIYAADRLDTSTFEDDLDGSARITFVEFATAMAGDDFICSAPTVRAKWTMLCADGIISPSSGDKHLGTLYWGALKSACTMSVALAVDRIVQQEKQKNKKTNTEVTA